MQQTELSGILLMDKPQGCTMSGSVHDVVNNLSAHIAEQLEQEKANA